MAIKYCFIIAYILTIFGFLTIISCKSQRDTKETENSKYYLDSNFKLQLLFMPSFCSSALVEIDVTPKKKTLIISPARYEYYKNEDFLSFPKSIYTISDEDFDSLKNNLKGINLKKLKSNEAAMVDGIGVSLLYNNFIDSINLIKYYSPENSSVHHKILVAVLNLCLKYVKFDPTAKAIEDILNYFNRELGILKISDYSNYYRFYNGNYQNEEKDYSSFFKTLPENDSVIFNLSNISSNNKNFETNFVNYLKKNENCIIVVEDYLKNFKHKSYKRDYNFSFYINLLNYFKNSSNYYDSNDSLMAILDSIKYSLMFAPFRRYGEPIPVPDAEMK